MGRLHLLNGSFRGKGGAFVGSKWKGIPTIRPYVVSKNPNTPAQQLQREHFRLMQQEMQEASLLIRGYTTLEKEKMPLLSALMKHNKYSETYGGLHFDTQNAVFTKGNGIHIAIEYEQTEPTTQLLVLKQIAGATWNNKVRGVILSYYASERGAYFNNDIMTPTIRDGKYILSYNTSQINFQWPNWVWVIDTQKGKLMSSPTYLL